MSLFILIYVISNRYYNYSDLNIYLFIYIETRFSQFLLINCSCNWHGVYVSPINVDSKHCILLGYFFPIVNQFSFRKWFFFLSSNLNVFCNLLIVNLCDITTQFSALSICSFVCIRKIIMKNINQIWNTLLFSDLTV